MASWIGRNVGVAELMLGAWLQGWWSELLHNGHCAETLLIGLHIIIGIRLLNIWHQPTVLPKAFLAFVFKIFYTLNNTPILALNQYNRVVKKRCQLSSRIPFIQGELLSCLALESIDSAFWHHTVIVFEATEIQMSPAFKG